MAWSSASGGLNLEYFHSSDSGPQTPPKEREQMQDSVTMCLFLSFHLLRQQKAASLPGRTRAKAPGCTAIIPELLNEVTSNDSNSISHRGIKQRPLGTTEEREQGNRQLGFQSSQTKR